MKLHNFDLPKFNDSGDIFEEAMNSIVRLKIQVDYQVIGEVDNNSKIRMDILKYPDTDCKYESLLTIYNDLKGDPSS